MKNFTTYMTAMLMFISINIFAQKTWTGATSNAWNTSTNWSPVGAPASTDDVIIPSAPANQPLINGAITPVCKNLTINSGATLSISATSLNNALLTASGNAVINGTLSIGGAITKTGKLVVVNITWGSTGSMSGFLNGSIDVSGNWEFSTGSAISMGYCSVNFTGSTNTLIISKSAGSSFYTVTINKNSGNTVDISSTSTATLNFGSTVTINTGSTLLCHATNTIVFSNSLYNTGHFSFGIGTVSFEKTSGTQIIQVNTSDLFNYMIINSGGTVTINNTLNILNDLTINSGIFDPLGNIVVLFGDWDNNVGPDSFTEGTSRVIFCGGNYHQYSSTENFNILEVNKSIGGAFRVNTGTVTCNQYDWTAGSIDVLNNGTFTALDLADQGIRGNYYVNTGCTINLYQDASQYVDLGGNLTFTSGGTINVYGGNGTVSQWPTYANASLTMNGGTLDFKDQSITINTLSGYSLTSNITGGTIRTSRGFFNNRTDFNPTGGTVELYGSVNSGLDFINGSLWNLEIDKDVASSVTLNTNLTINNNLTVNSGTITYLNKVLTLANTLNINSGGVFNLGMAGQLKLASGKYLNVNSGGLLKTEGTGADNAIITHSAGFYFISIKSGGIISAKNTYFQYLNYVQLMSGSTLDPANAFYRCTFTNNSAAPVGAVLSFANDQVVSIHEANFPALNSGYNVLKSNNAGHVYFKDATGAYAGATYENDPYNRIDWSASMPGIWTGMVSSDWNTLGNWDDLSIPTASINVTIPAGTPNSPVIGAGNAYCNNLTIEPGALLTQNNGGYFYVSGDFDADEGLFIMNGASYLYFTGGTQSIWYSTADNIYTNIRILKAVSTTIVQLPVSNNVMCSGTFEIREGVFDMSGTVNVSNTGTSAFEVEDGGKFYKKSGIWVDGYVHFFNGSIYEEVGILYFLVGKDFIADEAAIGGQVSTLVMHGSGTQYIDIKPGSNFTFRYIYLEKPDGICYIKSDDLFVEYNIEAETGGTLSAYTGPLQTASFDIYLGRSWINEPGATFEPGLGKVVCTSDKPAYCKNVEFNILEVDKTTNMMEIHENVTCAAYNWTSGTVKVINGATFTANDLLDNAIKGSFICEEGGTINLTNSGTGTFVDLAGELHNFGGTINISGSISYWPYGGNAVVEMTGGVIDLKTCGLTINNTATYSLTDNITGGTIKTPYGFIGNRADFTPGLGTFEFYGSTDAFISQSNGCTLPTVLINKSSKEGEKSVGSEPIFDERSGEMLSDGGKANMISLTSPFTITGNLTIQSGILKSNNHNLNIEGNWDNMVGPDGFLEGTGRVVFAGYTAQLCSNEEFYILELNKPAQHFYNYPEATISCQVYDWTQGGIWIAGSGNFYAADLADNGIYGNWTLYGDSIELHQDEAQSAGIEGNMFIESGVFDVYGGSLTNSHWGGYSDVNFTMTGGILDYHDARISIGEYTTPHLFNCNITSGLIRTKKSISISNPSFQPAGGIVEIYSDNYSDHTLYCQNGASLYNLLIDVGYSGGSIGLFVCSDIPLQNATINSGLVATNGGNFHVSGDFYISGPNSWYLNREDITILENNAILTIENGGEFQNWPNATLQMGNNSVINVNNDGSIKFSGTESNIGILTSSGASDKYGFNLNDGGEMHAFFTRFENMNSNGIKINPGANINNYFPYYSFGNCEFRNGAAGGTLLNINNDQNLEIENAVFPANSWGGLYNVTKSNNAGNVTFLGATGGFSGEAYENDSYNRVHWDEITNYLDAKVWLEGPFNNTDMNTNLTGLSNFPLNQPYNVYPWNYAGTESVTTVPGNVVDWVLVELRDAPTAAQATSATRIARMAAFLKKDGSIVGLNGTSLLQFSNSITHQLYVIIWHRNHIEIMSAVPLVKVVDIYSYDFRTDVTKAYGAGVGYKDWGAGVALMVGADGNADGNINNFDKIGQWNPNAGKKGYLSADFNMDAQVNNIDKNNYWWPNEDEGFNSQVPE